MDKVTLTMLHTDSHVAEGGGQSRCLACAVMAWHGMAWGKAGCVAWPAVYSWV